MAWLLDTNVFIDAKNQYYGMDFCPAFWDWLSENNRSGKVFSIDEVKSEILKGEDALADWAERQGQGFFLKIDLPEAIAREVSEYVQRNFERAACDAFFESADYYLVVFAKERGYTVVTHEVKGISKKRIKIPNACSAFGVKCVTLFDMLRHGDARFILKCEGKK